MSVTVDHMLLPTLKQYGAFDIGACFNCGNCTAVCPLSKGDATFPRRVIRYAQVGMRENLLSSKELWACYACGQCTETCPRQADPSEFMASARRYAIASYDRTRIAHTMYTRPLVATVFAVVLAAFFALFMYSAHGPAERRVARDLRVHSRGPDPQHRDRRDDPGRPRRAGRGGQHGAGRSDGAKASVPATSSAAGLRSDGRPARPGSRSGASPSPRKPSARIATRTRRRPRRRCRGIGGGGSCTGSPCGVSSASWPQPASTTGWPWSGIKATGSPVPVWYPVRLLGTVAGLMLVYGVTMLIVDRIPQRPTGR